MLLLVLAGVAWGTSGTLGTLLARHGSIGFLSVAGHRIFVGGLLVLGYAVATRRLRKPTTRAGWLQVGALGAASALYQWGFFSAVGLIGVPLATMIAIGSAPLMVAGVDLLTGRIRLGLALAGAMLLAVAGLVLLVGTPPSLPEGALLPGVVGAVIAGASFASISLLGSRRVPDFDPVTGTGLAFLAGGAAVLLGAFTSGQSVVARPSFIVLGLTLCLGLVPSAVAYLAYLFGLRTHTGTTGSLVSLLEPVTAAVIAGALLGQRLTATGTLGAAILLSSVALAARVRSR